MPSGNRQILKIVTELDVRKLSTHASASQSELFRCFHNYDSTINVECSIVTTIIRYSLLFTNVEVQRLGGAFQPHRPSPTGNWCVLVMNRP